MDRRTNESPMEWEYDQKKPLHPDSPWLKHIVRSGTNSFYAQNNFASPSSPSSSSIFGAPSIFGTPSKQHSQNHNLPFLGSTSRSATAPGTPTFQNTSSLQDSRTTLFPGSRNSAPTAPTNPNDPFNSSDTLKTPNTCRDLDETPDTTPSLHGLRLTDSAREKILTTTTERVVSGRGELRRMFPEASSKRVQKRKQKILGERDVWGKSSPRRGGHGARSDYGGTSDEDTSDEAGPIKPPKPPRNPSTPKQSKWDHHFPVLVSSYLQLMFNIFIVMVVLYLIISFIRTIQADVDTKVKQFSTHKQTEIEGCQRDYSVNRCGDLYRAPALEIQCQGWESCMNQDPDEVGRAKVSAQTFAEILNSLIEPISYKAMFFCTVLLFGTLYITNAAFGIYRAKMAVGHQPDPPAHTQVFPPTPMPPAPWAAPHPSWSMPVHMPMPMPSSAVGWGGSRLEPKTPSKRSFFKAGGDGVRQLEMN